ncbi:MAG: histidine phosphatase family protein [Rhodospirillaceae bacterium]|jgi:alpha-ribazole phosphatase|nr:histidine phosphatase family protein [Rhodospirillaceae bacterium]MBT6136334.1 histidine phosphatase family protein [Rhodospirillaceae bacterium]
MSSTTSWHFIRHAPVTHLKGTVYGSTDPVADVSDAAAFDALAKALPKEAIWVTSHLQRTHQTANAVHAAGYPTVAYAQDPRLGEQNFGDWHGMTHVDLHASRAPEYHRFWLAPAKETPPGGESFLDVVARVSASMAELTEKHAGQDIICVAHGGTIRAALSIALGIEPEKALAFSTENLSITIMDHIGESDGQPAAWRVRGVNLIA